MSADLFAAFGDSEAAEVGDHNSWQNSQPVPTDLPESSAKEATNLQEDTWQPWPNTPATPARSKIVTKVPSPLWHRDRGGTDVLFDAAEDVNNDDDDDDFGDFEEAEEVPVASAKGTETEPQNQNRNLIYDQKTQPSTNTTRPIQQPAKEIDLLGIEEDTTAPDLNDMRMHGKASDSDRGDHFTTFETPTPVPFGHDPPESQKPPTEAVHSEVSPTEAFDDDWGTFEQAHTGSESFVDQTSASHVIPASQPLFQTTSIKTEDLWDLSAFESTMNQNLRVNSSSKQDKTLQQPGLVAKQSFSVQDKRQPPGLLPDNTQRSTTQAPSTNIKSIPQPRQQQQQNQPEQDSNEDEAWDDFECLEADNHQQQEATTQQQQKRTTTTGSSTLSNRATATNIPITPTPSRPTNIPPPSTLLQLLPKIFSLLASQAATTTSASASSSPESTNPLAQSILHIYTVAARILAGRSHRWKRDTILAQSMSISAAGTSSGGRGMKLTTLDKGESRKEDQEAELAVAAWGKYAHVLNAVMNKAKVQKPAMSLSAMGMRVKTETGVGVLQANHVCPICGLKRNERVVGIDGKVNDTFGEFWAEHWGHRDCFDLWYRYKDMLSQR